MCNINANQFKFKMIVGQLPVVSGQLLKGFYITAITEYLKPPAYNCLLFAKTLHRLLNRLFDAIHGVIGKQFAHANGKTIKMKRILEITLMAFCVGAILYSTFANAQTINLTRKYRVVAYKMGNPLVTSTSNETVIVPTMSLYIPNSFTPNGDGMNDNFGAFGESITNFNIEIFDRWGMRVFESSDVNHRWDGMFKGKLAPQGTYVYKISAQGADGNKTARKGTVNLIN